MAARGIGTGMRLTMQMVRKKFSQVKHIQTEDLQRLVSSSEPRQFVLLDVRSKEEYDVSHIQGAHSVNPNNKNMSEVLDFINKQVPNPEESKTVVAYCSVGYRASILVTGLTKELSKPERTKDRNSTNLFNLEGSIFQWANEGRQLVDNDNLIVKSVHPYNSVFGKMLNSGLASYGKDSQL